MDTAESGFEAIDKIDHVFSTREGYFDIIFMDIQMPDMDGVETTQKLHEKYPKGLPPIVAMTAYSMKEDRDRFLSQGMDDYVAKPIRAKHLIGKVQELIGKGSGTESDQQALLPRPGVGTSHTGSEYCGSTQTDRRKGTGAFSIR